MQHERDYDERTATPDVRTLDDVCRDAVKMDRSPTAVRPSAVMPERRNYAAEMARDAMRFAAKLSRKVTGYPRKDPFPPRDFRI